MTRKPRRLIFGAISFCVTIGVAIPSSAASASPLPAAAQEAVNQGMSADQQGNYLAAIGHFREALTAAPDDPQIFFNLGVAESKIPGRELRAISWFGAYLSVEPDAPNTKAVLKEINTLRSVHRQTLLAVVRLADEAAAHSGNDGFVAVVDQYRARAGDFSTALIKAAAFQPRLRDSVYSEIALSQALAGDSAGAIATFGLIEAEEVRSVAQTRAIEAQLDVGDIQGALQIWSLMSSLARVNGVGGFGEPTAASLIAGVRSKLGDRAGAKAIIAAALRDAALVTGNRHSVYVDIAKAQARDGDMSGALRTVSLLEDTFDRDIVLGNIAGVLAERGEISKAFAVTKKISAMTRPFDFQSIAQSMIAIAQAEHGDMRSAKRTAASIRDGTTRIKAQKSIAQTQAREESAAAEWLECLDSSEPSSLCALNKTVFLDLRGRLHADASASDSEALASTLLDTMFAMVQADYAARQHLARQGSPLGRDQ